MKVTIVSMMEFVNFPAPGEQEVVVRTTYRTDTGFQGTLDIPKADFSADEVIKRIKAEVPEGTELIGQEIDIGPKIETEVEE